LPCRYKIVIEKKQVRYLKIIEKSGYQALPWVRYITQNGDYELRMPDSVNATKRAAALT